MYFFLEHQHEFGPVFMRHVMKACMENEITSVLEGGESLHPGRCSLRVPYSNGEQCV